MNSAAAVSSRRPPCTDITPPSHNQGCDALASVPLRLRTKEKHSTPQHTTERLASTLDYARRWHTDGWKTTHIFCDGYLRMQSAWLHNRHGGTGTRLQWLPAGWVPSETRTAGIGTSGSCRSFPHCCIGW